MEVVVVKRKVVVVVEWRGLIDVADEHGVTFCLIILLHHLPVSSFPPSSFSCPSFLTILLTFFLRVFSFPPILTHPFSYPFLLVCIIYFLVLRSPVFLLPSASPSFTLLSNLPVLLPSHSPVSPLSASTSLTPSLSSAPHFSIFSFSMFPRTLPFLQPP